MDNACYVKHLTKPCLTNFWVYSQISFYVYMSFNKIFETETETIKFTLFFFLHQIKMISANKSLK